MKILLMNIHGLGIQNKKMSLIHIIDIDKFDILLLQETMERGDTLVDELRNSLMGWDFLDMEYNGAFGGIIYGWTQIFELINYYVTFSSVFMVLFNKNLGYSLTLMNMYKPYEGIHNF